jgi:hypothetical protein
MLDTTGAATTWDYSFTAGNPGYNGFSGGTGYLGGIVGSGSAAWVNNQVVLSTGVGVNKGVGWYSTKLVQLNTTKQYRLDIFGSINATGRNLEARVNGGASQNISCGNNSTITMTFDNLQPNGSGELLLEIRATDSSNGFAYINAMRITELDTIVQDFSIDQSTVQTGSTISGTYAGWPTIPTASVVLADAEGNTLILTPTVTGGAGSGTWSATIPALPSVGGNVELLLFGATTVSFGGFTAKAGPALQVAGTQTLTTLASGFDDYVFQGWDPQPVAGDQLVTNTAECYFRTDGDLVWPEMTAGVAPIWYVDKTTGTVYGLQVDSTELSTLEYAENLPLLSFGITPKALTLDVGSSFASDLPLTNFYFESKPLDGVFGVSFIGEIPKLNYNVSPKDLTLTSGVGFIEDLPKLSLSITSKTLGLTIFKAITIDPRRVYKIK